MSTSTLVSLMKFSISKMFHKDDLWNTKLFRCTRETQHDLNVYSKIVKHHLALN